MKAWKRSGTERTNMAVEIKVPELGESISEIQIAEWLVKEGDTVTKDQNVVSVDSEKATVEIPAPTAGTVAKILKPNGATAKVGDVIAQIEADGKAEKKNDKPVEPAKATAAPPSSQTKPRETEAARQRTTGDKEEEIAAQREKRAAKNSVAEGKNGGEKAPPNDELETRVTSEAKRLVAEHKPVIIGAKKEEDTEAAPQPSSSDRADEIKPMTPLRRTVAKRLVEAQQTMAILTTFNEIDMSAVMGLRKQYQESFQEKYGVKVGFMSFFIKAVIEALKEVPQLNAEIRGNDIIFHRYYDIAVAIGAGKGLIVPPLHNAERMSFAEIEKAVADLATRAKENKLKPEELEGGTFTISNGGVYGSLLSTPIINPPQSGILGLHAIQERPVAHDGQVVIRPMMFVALSYDHRIVDGREAVTFLRRVKEIIENPARMILEV
jgi:2-oxoglutarate dehydrogenase E2 component (dihydrolipoamide succinyltransferase)